MDLKKNRKIKLYIKNYILSSVNLINLSKLIISQQPIDDKKLAQIIEFSIFSAFKKSLKEILDKLTIINEEKLLGIKIDKIKTNKNFFIQYGIKENDAIKYSRILFWFKNIIKFFEDIFPKKISILNLELTMFWIYYKFYKKTIKKKKLIIFKMLSNKYLRTIMKKIDLKINDNLKNNKIKELYDILLSSNISININIKNEEIIYNGKKISLIDINLEDINCFKF